MRHNHVAVAVAVIASNLLGFLLHAPFTYLEPWARALRLEPEALAGPPTSALVLGVAGSFAIVYGLSWLFGRLGVQSALEGLRVAAVLGVALMLPSTLIQYAFAGIGAAAMAVDGGHQLASVCLAGVLLGGWRRRPAARSAFSRGGPAHAVGSGVR